ncbi:PTS sugar transporter subunit IIA [Gilliamella sp. wkB112]|uniref:PTS sugar transporter subunit IIA n=1 Tax=Gilliamella sp. wkB112 TaxID=3120257 RepID=UPI00080E8F43|nr:PTS sugar transporter subunit IIA [Gilliamella apicola]OCG00178.1 PTS sugar transporter subunit IIA [Gilliamella apicola]
MIEIITEENLHLGCYANNKEQVLSMLNEAFQSKGYVNQDCLVFLIEREKQVSTFLGNGITLPHLPMLAKQIIVKTGIEIFQFPDGVIWDRKNIMFIAIGVIAKEKEHIDLLKEIVTIFSDEIISNVLSILTSKQDFLRILKQNYHS